MSATVSVDSPFVILIPKEPSDPSGQLPDIGDDAVDVTFYYYSPPPQATVPVTISDFSDILSMF